MVNADNVSVPGEDCMRSLVTHFLLLTVIALLGLLCARLYLFTDAHTPLAIPSISGFAKSEPTQEKLGSMSDDLRTREIFRQVVREELVEFEQKLEILISDQMAVRSASEFPAGGKAMVSNPPENANLKAEVEGDIFAMISQGDTTPAEMAILQSKIARLPDSQRREALSEISRAMNDGRLAATF
ncbi:MAG: hypothetical protein NXH70_11630 [Hyphomonas sp.]|nr:hypothetical protein [Hyphomonas sp.]